MIIKTLSAPNKKSFWTAFFWTFLILVLSLKNPTKLPNISITNIDKIVHFMFYFVFVFLWYRYLVFSQKTATSSKIVLVLTSVALGALIEWAQGYFTQTRQADWYDIIANTIGSLVGIYFSYLFFRKEKRI